MCTFGFVLPVFADCMIIFFQGLKNFTFGVKTPSVRDVTQKGGLV